eukprot:TRINITY_DN25310_c0_g2_i1.p3 TRINITY_DN25310_c0_g2~~TRINITY_DN25310_c0_g2_i1.p3  ORF type:complete len:105 (-),score=26.09 TRINITY_DN25310_c0_g2_i1:1163-1477(-)
MMKGLLLCALAPVAQGADGVWSGYAPPAAASKSGSKFLSDSKSVSGSASLPGDAAAGAAATKSAGSPIRFGREDATPGDDDRTLVPRISSKEVDMSKQFAIEPQ